MSRFYICSQDNEQALSLIWVTCMLQERAYYRIMSKLISGSTWQLLRNILMPERGAMLRNKE